MSENENPEPNVRPVIWMWIGLALFVAAFVGVGVPSHVENWTSMQGAWPLLVSAVVGTFIFLHGTRTSRVVINAHIEHVGVTSLFAGGGLIGLAAWLTMLHSDVAMFSLVLLYVVGTALVMHAANALKSASPF